MAFQKSIALPTGVSANYWRITSFRWDRSTREASALFALFKDSSTASTGQPLLPVAAKFRLFGSAFDQYLGAAALASASGDIVAQLYLAAKQSSQDYAADPNSDRSMMVICDFGADVFADAIDC